MELSIRTLLGVTVVFLSSARAEVVFVDDSATGTGDGSSWANAFVHLQDALAVAKADDQIWVAVGRYTPDATPPYSRTATFALGDGVFVYGGFAGHESSLAERAGLFDDTVLSGDLAADDLPSFANVGENSFHVVTVPDGVRTGIDGFRIVGGNADGSSFPANSGGAIHIDGASEVGVLRCSFGANQARDEGGAFFARGAITVLIESCEFRGNRVFDVPAQGGAVSVQNSSLWIVGSRFSNHEIGNYGAKGTTTRGGAVCAIGSPTTIRRSQFESNRVFGAASTLTGGGAVYTNSNLVLSDSDFFDNVIDSDDSWGGAVRVKGNTMTTFVAENCRFISNQSLGSIASGGAIDALAKVTLVGCFFAENETRDAFDWAYGGAVAAMPSLMAVNSVFVGNVAPNGSAIESGATTLVNCTIAANQAQGSGTSGANGAAAVYLTTGSNFVHNSILVGNTWNGSVSQATQIQGLQLNLARSCVEGWTGSLGGVGNFDADPLFVDPDGPDGRIGSADDDLRLLATSPCLEAGDASLLPVDTADADGDGITTEPLPVDLDLAPRVWLSHVASVIGVGGPPVIDLGAYERHGESCQTSLGFQGPGNVTLALCGDDLTAANTHATLFVTNAPPSSVMTLVVGAAISPSAWFGGILAPYPVLASFSIVIDSSGKAVVPIANRNGGPPVSVYAQGIVPGDIVKISNTLQITIGS